MKWSVLLMPRKAIQVLNEIVALLSTAITSCGRSNIIDFANNNSWHSYFCVKFSKHFANTKTLVGPLKNSSNYQCL